MTIKNIINNLNIFANIEKLSHICATKLAKDETEKEYLKYQFGLYGIFSFILTNILSIYLAFTFEYIYYLPFFVMIILFCLRSMSAGSHAQTPMWCFIWSNLNYLICGLSIIYLNQYYVIFFLFTLATCYIDLKNIPRYTKNGIHHSIEKQLLFRRKYIFRLNLINIINLIIIIFTYLEKFDLSNISTLLSMCILINRFALTKLSFWILDKLK